MRKSLVVVWFMLAITGCASSESRSIGGTGGSAAVETQGGNSTGSGGNSVQDATGGRTATAGGRGTADPATTLANGGGGTGGSDTGGRGTGGSNTGGSGTGGSGTGGLPDPTATLATGGGSNVVTGTTGSGGEIGTTGGAGTGLVRSANMVTARTKHTATLIGNDKVLIAGGSTTSPTDATATASAEIYDIAAGTFSATGSMAIARLGHTATLLANGTVLVCGASDSDSAEIYDPTTGTFSATGNMTAPRKDHTATLLDNGKVLIAGGYAGTSALTSAELYNPQTGTFSATGNLTEARYQHAATVLANKTVLLVGGYVPPEDTGNNDGLTSAEVYDPASGIFAATGSMQARRVIPTVTLLSNGTVLVSGGPHGFEGYFASNWLELYNPESGTFAATGAMKEARTAHTATLLRSGVVLFAGGYQGGGAFWKFLASTDLYTPASGSCAASTELTAEREYHTATLLADDSVLIAGGDSQGKPLASADVYRQ